jgi:uncharacterized membrane protein YgaE (UPF0421/DUF939 family)
MDIEIRKLRATLKLTDEENNELNILMEKEEVKSIDDANKYIDEHNKTLDGLPVNSNLKSSLNRKVYHLKRIIELLKI